LLECELEAGAVAEGPTEEVMLVENPTLWLELEGIAVLDGRTPVDST
jgi:hypothetical protein